MLTNVSLMHTSRHRIAVLIIAVLSYTGVVYGQVSGVSYTFSPVGEYIQWDNNAGITNGYGYGGSMGIGFGQYLEVHGTYLRSMDMRNDFSRFTIPDPLLEDRFDLLPSNDIQIERFGLTTKLNLYPGAIVPYVTAGSGIIRTQRSGLQNSESIYISGGVGLMASIASRYTLFAQANRFGYQYNPGSTFLSGTDLNNASLQPANFRQVETTNWSFTVGVKTYLGGRSYDDTSRDEILFLDSFTGGLANSRFLISPIYGQINFDESFGLRSTQHIIGIGAGLELGPFVGVHGFYWRGVGEEPGGNALQVDKMHMFGAEFKGTFFQTMLTPYVSFGGGYLAILDGYTNEANSSPSNQIFGLAGVGVDFDLSDRFEITTGLRTVMTTTEGFDNSIAPNSIELSPMFSFGVNIRLGSVGRIVPSRRSSDSDRPSRWAYEESDSRTIVSDEQQILIAREAALSVEIARANAAGDSAVARELTRERDALRNSARRSADTQEVEIDNRTFTLPVLKEGEIYIRFGTPSSAPMTAPAAAAPAVATAPETTSDEAAASRSREIERLEDRVARLSDDRARVEAPSSVMTEEALERRLNQFEERILLLLEDKISQAPTTSDVEESSDIAPALRPLVEPGDSGEAPAGELVGITGYFGVGNPLQSLLGVRADYGTVLQGAISLQPEFVLGFGSGSNMYNVNINAFYDLPSIRYIEPFEGYTGLGLGILAYSNPPSDVAGIQFVWSYTLGVTYDIGPGKAFVEYNNLNFFQFNRFNAGYRYSW